MKAILIGVGLLCVLALFCGCDDSEPRLLTDTPCCPVCGSMCLWPDGEDLLVDYGYCYACDLWFEVVCGAMLPEEML